MSATLTPCRGLFAVVLAAGAATRFGDSKQLALFRGVPLVRHAVRAAESVCGANVIVVAGSNWEQVLAACAPQKGFFVVNERFADGMSTSIVRGVGALPDSARGVLLVLADQPLITDRDLGALIDAWRRQPDVIVCSRFGDTFSPPAVFPRRCFDELAELRGDQGARPVIERHRGSVVAVELDHAAFDVDTPDDLEGLSAPE